MELSHVPIVVRDQERALRFYTETLGFEKRADFTPPGSPRWLTVGVPGRGLELVLVQGTPHDGAGVWSLRTDDCLKAFEQLRAKGVRFVEPEPVSAPFGTYANFTDPDGNRFNLLQPKAQPWK